MEDSGIDSGDTKPVVLEDERIFGASDSSCGSSGSIPSPPRNPTQNVSSKQLQRRLEARIESAKRMQRNQEYKNTPNLIPIQRLPIPGSKEQQPLVEWDTDDSEEDIVSFFPSSRLKDTRHQELTDTFSIEELSISGGDEDEEEDLHLVPPQPSYKSFGCCGVPDKCNIM